MDDLISRQALCEYALNQKDKSVTPNDIMRFPSAQPEQRWIPCSERLPERCKHYIVTDFGDVEEAYYTCDGHWFSVDGNKLKDVTAWMPLPEPWRGR